MSYNKNDAPPAYPQSPQASYQQPYHTNDSHNNGYAQSANMGYHQQPQGPPRGYYGAPQQQQQGGYYGGGYPPQQGYPQQGYPQQGYPPQGQYGYYQPQGYYHQDRGAGSAAGGCTGILCGTLAACCCLDLLF